MNESANDRLSALRARLKQARGENLQAVEEEGRKVLTEEASSRNDRIEGKEKTMSVRKTNAFKRRRTRDATRSGVSVDPLNSFLDDDEDDPVLKSLNRQVEKIVPVQISQSSSGEGAITYGGTGGIISNDHREKLAVDVVETEERRMRFHRRRAFVEDKANIDFINEGNRNFNRLLGKHYDGYESVRKVKDSLERGTALP